MGLGPEAAIPADARDEMERQGVAPDQMTAIRRVRFREAMTGAILSGHRRIPPYGVAGGRPGALGRNRVERADGTVLVLSGTDTVEVAAGDVFVIETPGFGYGPPAAEKQAAE